MKKLLRFKNFPQNYSFNILGSASAQIINSIGFVCLIFIFSPTAVGEYVTGLAIAFICSAIFTFRIEILGFYAKDKSIENMFFNIAAASILQFSMLLTFLLFFIFIGFEFLDPANNFDFRFYFFICILSSCLAFIGLISTVLNKYGLFESLMRFRMVVAFTTIISQVSLGFLQPSVESLFFGVIFGAVFGLLVEGNARRIFLNFEFFTSVLKEIYKNWSFLYVDTKVHLTATALIQLPVLFIGQVYGVEFSGFFSIAQRLSQLPLSMLGNALNEVRRNYFMVLKTKGLELDIFASRSVKYSIYFGLLLGIGIYIVAIFVPLSLLPISWFPVPHILELFAIIVPSRFIYVSNGYLFHASGKIDRALQINYSLLVASALPWCLNIAFDNSLLIYSLSLSVIYSCGCIYLWRLAVKADQFSG